MILGRLLRALRNRGSSRRDSNRQIPQLGQQVHDALPVSHLIEVPQAVHSPLEALSWPACAEGIVTVFLNDPDTGPDADCAANFTLRALGIPMPTRFE